MTAVNPISGDLDFVPYVDNAETAANYLAAGLNFVEFDPRQAVRAFAKALETAPGEPTIMMNLARSYDLEGDKGSAVAMYAQVLQSGDASLSDMALFFMATDLRELGETSEALKVYRELAGIGRDPAYRGKAAAWVEKLTAR
jgi:tetratricopeptide (TPR) repeat protein